MPEKQYITAKEVAEMTTCAVNTVNGWRFKNMGPRFHRLGGRIVYDRQDVQDWIKAHIVGTEDQAA
ncbi:helix-turn-helix transcriptional regulator [Dermabacteraceae bacterium P7006]